MPTRDSAPLGSPCWVDLWTSDVDGSRTFYSELFGWEAQEPSPEFGGYFMFTRDGVPVAGGMGPMEDMTPTNTWKIYLDTDDLGKTLKVADAEGAQVISPAMAVEDMGTQAVLVDPTGATVGAWQPGTFPGFTLLGEHGAPSWFELHTRDYVQALTFYRTTFHWETDVVGDTEEFRYSTMRNPTGGSELAGIMDASSFLPADAPAHWKIYWYVDDVDAAAARVKKLGGTELAMPEDTPYGRMAEVADPAGAQFKLHTPNR